MYIYIYIYIYIYKYIYIYYLYKFFMLVQEWMRVPIFPLLYVYICAYVVCI